MAPRPRVVVHALASADGRLDGFPADLGLYYELAGAVPHDAVLAGSGTLLAAAAAEGVDLAGEDAPAPAVDLPDEADDTRPWLVVIDSGGRFTRLDWLRAAPHWRDVLVLCADVTPRAHLDRLAAAGVVHEVVGGERVDLAAALDLLARRYGVRAVRVDAGPTLVGVLLRAGLVDEVGIVVAPHLVGAAGERPLRLLDRLDAPLALDRVAVEPLRDGHVLLRYAVRPAAQGV